VILAGHSGPPVGSRLSVAEMVIVRSDPNL
jgi:hypothetical protein